MSFERLYGVMPLSNRISKGKDYYGSMHTVLSGEALR
jgi:hypothetical protein